MDTPGDKDGPGGSAKRWGTEFGPFLTLGLQLAASVVACFFLGRWLDSKFDTSPWLMLAGLLIGAVGGFMSFLRTAIDLGKKAEKQMREKNGAKHEEQP